MVASIAGVLGLMASAAVQSFVNTDDALAAFSLMSGGGIVVFAMGELSLPAKGERQETETEKHRRWARILTSRASGAAREGRCPRVRRLEKRVHAYDREVHDFVLMRDGAILKCLGLAPAPDPAKLDPDAAAPDTSLPVPVPLDPNAPPTVPPSPAPADPDAPTQLKLPPGTVIPPTP